VISVVGKSLVAQNAALVQALHYLAVALGGPGFTMPFGLLMAGVSVTAVFLKLLPRWLVAFGLLLALTGELSDTRTSLAAWEPLQAKIGATPPLV